MAPSRPRKPQKHPPQASRTRRIATIEDIERHVASLAPARGLSWATLVLAARQAQQHRSPLDDVEALTPARPLTDPGPEMSPAVAAIVGAAIAAGAGALAPDNTVVGSGHASIPAPRGKKTGRAPAVTLAEFRAHVAAHPGVSDRARARMLSSELARPVSRYSVMRLRRRLEIETP